MNVFEFAMQMVKDGEAYYRDLASRCQQEGVQKILLMLADDEVGHYNTLKILKEGTNTRISSTQVLREAKNLFQEIKNAENELNFEFSEIELYQKAIEIEKKSEAFYREKANEVEQQEIKEILLSIAEDEKKHWFLLKNTTEFLSRPKTWIENAEFNHLDDY